MEEQEILPTFEEIVAEGVYTEKGLDVSKFLRPDLSIWLEKLEYYVITVVKALETSATDNDVTLDLYGLKDYYNLRGLTEEHEKQKREESRFILGFVSTAAYEVSERDTLIIKYVE